MFDELTSASNLLHDAIERYSNACLMIQRSYARGGKLHITTPQLLLCMDVEVEFIKLLEEKLIRAKEAIYWSKSRLNIRTTVNDLPPELLGHIFHLVPDAQPCRKQVYDTGDTKAWCMYPTVLTHVCSRWREVAFNTPILWRHIDISTSPLLNQLHCNRLAKFYLNHVGQLSLDLHIFDPSYYPVSHFSNRDPLYELIVEVASRTSSFNLDADGTYDPNIHGSILSTFFKASTPGILEQLVMRHKNDYNSGFIKAEDDLDDDGLDVGLPLEQFESLLSGVTVLHLDRLYPRWNSRAYHGLVELRLNGLYISINESDLVGILRSSPGLRLLELGLDIEDPLPIETQVSPIILRNLKSLNVSELICNQLSTLLRWLAPDSNQLQFAVRKGTYEDLNLKESLGQFLSRSRVTRVYVKRLSFSQIIELLELSPNLQELIASWVTFDQLGALKLRDKETISTLKALHLHLEYFCIIHSSVHMEDILALIRIPGFVVKTIAFHWCTFFCNSTKVPKHQEGSLLEKLYWDHPNVRVIIQCPEEPYPVKSWGLFASHYNF